LVGAVYREAQDAERYLARLNGAKKAHIVKLHYPTARTIQWVIDGKVKNIYTVRHPLDAVASFKEVFGDPIQSAARRVRDSLKAAERFREENASPNDGKAHRHKQAAPEFLVL